MRFLVFGWIEGKCSFSFFCSSWPVGQVRMCLYPAEQIEKSPHNCGEDTIGGGCVFVSIEPNRRRQPQNCHLYRQSARRAQFPTSGVEPPRWARPKLQCGLGRWGSQTLWVCVCVCVFFVFCWQGSSKNTARRQAQCSLFFTRRCAIHVLYGSTVRKVADDGGRTLQILPPSWVATFSLELLAFHPTHLCNVPVEAYPESWLDPPKLS